MTPVSDYAQARLGAMSARISELEGMLLKLIARMRERRREGHSTILDFVELDRLEAATLRPLRDHRGGSA